MLQVARLAPRLLGGSAELVSQFLLSQLQPDGGFQDRAGDSDLYYTVFGLEGLLALQTPIPSSRIAAYLRTFGDGDELDFIHLTCLARCWVALPPPYRGELPRDAILNRMESYRSTDGGYDHEPGSEMGTIYGCFMALAAYQDLGALPPEPERMLPCIDRLRTDDGGYANQDDLPLGLTPSSSAAAALYRHLDRTPPPGLDRWLLDRAYPDGGFFAIPHAPMPDLLSTAVALHALSGMKADISDVKEACLDFIDSLWTNKGGFYGNWADDTLDCEYTYYGLLALGHLSL